MEKRGLELGLEDKAALALLNLSQGYIRAAMIHTPTV